jgi:uncharacterized protein (UPF0335 family)
MKSDKQKTQMPIGIVFPKFVKYPKILYLEECSDILGHAGYVFEKIDGSLSQVRINEQGLLLGGSKSNYITGSSQRPFWASRFLKWMHSNKSLYNLPRELIMFGEWLEPVTVEYHPENLDKFYFLDLAYVKKDKPVFFDYDEAIGYLVQWEIKGIEVSVPISRGFLDQENVTHLVETEQSRLGTEIEGVVLKNYRIGLFSKYLHPKYSEIRAQAKTLEGKYLTDIRVKKAIRRLKDEGHRKLTLDQVVNEVASDIETESGIGFDITAIRGVIRAKDLFQDRR